jgi:hypothetical protein
MPLSRDPDWCRDQAWRFRKKAEGCVEEETICESYRRVAEAYEALAGALEERNHG